MLTHLQIRDFAIVDAVELEFGPGFTALTGETGAGKSILVDALLLAVGGRADSGAVRHGAQRADVSATFDVSANRPALDWLDEQQLASDGEAVLRRTLSADGRSRAWVNGQTVPVQSLRALGERLVDVHGQLEFQSLVRRGYQRELLDQYGDLGADVEAMGSAWREWRSLDAERRDFEARDRDRDHRMELLEHWVAELAALDPKPDEPRMLGEERKRIAALGRLADGAMQVGRLLAGEDGDVVTALGRAGSVIRPLVALDPALGETARLIEEASIAGQEAAASLRRYTATLEADPARQEWLEARLAALEDAARKHRVEPAALPELQARLEQELAALRDGASNLASLGRRLEEARRQRDGIAQRLSQSRREAAGRLDARVTELMQALGMPGGVFRTRSEPRDAEDCAEHGRDDVDFMVSANPGQPPRPIAKVASGGELSRISLALQVATLNVAHLPCLVFDEVDAGIGGAVAETVGRQLRALAAAGQVLCVTHLAQVATQAGRQLRVAKHTTAGTTTTSIEVLEPEQRVEEIARMLGGSRITERTREHAREMLAGAARPEAQASRASRGAGSSRGRSGRAGSANGR